MKPIVLYIYQILTLFLPETKGFLLKNTILKFAGVSIGKNTKICSSVKIIGNGNLIIGKNCWIGPQCIISSSYPAKIELGDNIDVAPRVSFITGSHKINVKGNRIAGEGSNKSIYIENGCWIGTSSIILSNVVIGSMSIISANSVVKKNIPERVIFSSISTEVTTPLV